MTNLTDDPGLMDPKVNPLIPEGEPEEDLCLEAAVASGPPAAEETNELIPESEEGASRADLICRIENIFAGGLSDEVDLGDGARLYRAASAQLVIAQGGWSVVADRASVRLLLKVLSRLER